MLTSKTASLVCANCGKEGSDVTNTCNKCKSVMYCNAACKKKHRHKHKKECERRVDEKLFNQPPPREDCPICFLRLPTLITGCTYMACCGKMICCGCTHAVQSRAVSAGRQEEDDICPFCRTPPPSSDSDEEMITRYNKRIELNDADAIHTMGCFYSEGKCGLPQDYAKALEFWHRAAELENAPSYYNIGAAYINGEGTEVDQKKAIHYWELAAMGGDEDARHNLGAMECNAGNHNRALRHFMIAVKDGGNDSLKTIREMVTFGNATKDDYSKALQVYQTYLNDIKSEQRDEAAADDDDCKYYDSPF